MKNSSTAARLRTVQSSSSSAAVSSPAIVTKPAQPHQVITLHEMSQKAEIEPLLSSTSNEANQYTNMPHPGNSNNNSVHVVIDNPEPNNRDRTDTGSLESLREENSLLLIADKPVIVRTHVQNVYLLNTLALLFVSVNMTFNLAVLSIIHERIPMDQPHLPDMLFDIFPDRRRFLDLTEYFIIFQMIGVCVLLFFHKSRSLILRRSCLIMGVIYFFRALCMASTQLPLASRNYQCSPQLKNSSNPVNLTSFEFFEIVAARVFSMSLGMGLSINGHHTYCGDYIFSGHTVIIVLTYLIFQEYLFPKRKTLIWRVIHVADFILSVISLICIIISRGHYSIDIIIAYFVTTNSFWIYHTLCTTNLSNTKANYLTRVWWFKLFVYFENIKLPTTPNSSYQEGSYQVQRKFEWPLPWPKFSRRRHRQFTA